ncbi:hypothetical protein ACLOJK_015605 [Asimina triloba]
MANIAEAVVAFLVNRLGDQLIQEASSLRGVRDQMEWVESQFRCMQAFLKDAEAKSDKDERVKHWMREVRDAAHLAEDIIDTFVLEIAPLRRPGFSGAMKRYTFIFTEIISSHHLVSKIEKMKEKLDSISGNRVAYGIQDIRHGERMGSGMGQRLSSPHVEELDFVGFQTNMEALIKQLTAGELRRSVVSVVGMGGLGKTTLARKLYQSDAVKRHFHPRLWITVSQVYGVEELLNGVMKKCTTGPSAENMDADELREKIAQQLRGKTYLVVLDDVWSPKAWEAVKDAFPDSSNGSRVLLTTRNKDVALCADASSTPHELRLLNEGESWELFLKKAFPSHETNSPLELKQLKKEILSKCRGLPLAIVVMGGLLSRRKEPREWQNALKSIGWQLIDGEDRISEILSLSYKDLPYYSKPCFLYLGIFPEDSEIPAKKLIRLWVAEGFLQERGGLTLEEVGEECLRDLIQRNLIQVSSTSSRGSIKSCRIHDLLRDFALSQAEKDAFLDIQSLAAAAKPCKGRRLAVHGSERFDFLSLCTPTLRSLLTHSQGCQGFHRIISGREEKLICGSFKLLRVLDIVGVEVEQLPNEIGELIHLKYLGCEMGSESLPSSIANLANLQTLCISSTFTLIKMPIAVLKMQQLRHVRVGDNIRRIANHDYWIEREGDFWIEIEGQPALLDLFWGSSSSSLQTLKNIVACEWMNDGCLGRLRKLRKLGIDTSSMPYRRFVEAIWQSIMKLESLESLYVTALQLGRCAYIGSLGQVPPLKHLPKLCKLHLGGKLENPLILGELPRNLTKLILEASCLKEDPLPILEKLKGLRILVLGRDSYRGEAMRCSARGFPQLQSLHISGLSCFREWRVEKGSMPCLLDLLIRACTNLKVVPDLQHVPTLKKFKIVHMNPEFVAKIQRGTGEDWCKIQHVSRFDDRGQLIHPRFLYQPRN